MGSRKTNLSNESPPGWYYEMQELGYNHRISDILCALGNSQLKRAKEGLKRKAIAKKYLKDLSGLPLKILVQIFRGSRISSFCHFN